MGPPRPEPRGRETISWRPEQLRDGDRDAFDAFIREHWMTLVYYVKDRVRTMEHAEDLAQEAFARLWEARAGINPSGSVVTYLFQIARNLVVDELRKLEVRRRWQDASIEPAFDRPSPLQALEQAQTLDALGRAVDGLPERRREAFILVHVQGLSYREAGEVMGNAPQTVANQVAAALVELRRILAPVMAGHRG